MQTQLAKGVQLTTVQSHHLKPTRLLSIFGHRLHVKQLLSGRYYRIY
ncbi:hypothetical protein M1857_00530 [Lactiplantibacillus plantarum]|nr:hypothetical protein M1857_00530 [Lactiplantibacillus plantarum]